MGCRICFRKSLLVGVAIVAVLGSLPVAAEEVRVRSAPHDGFFRLVFDWRAPVGYEVRAEGQALVVTFEREIESDFTRVRQTLGDVVQSATVEADGRTVRLALNAPHTVRHFVLDGSVVIDASPVANDGGAGTAENVRVRVGEHEDFSRLVFDWAEPVAYDVDHSGDRALVSFARPAAFDLSMVVGALPRGLIGASAAGEKVELELGAGVGVRAFRDGPRVVVDLLFDDAAQVVAEVDNAEIAPAPVSDSDAAADAVVAAAISEAEQDGHGDADVAQVASAPVALAPALEPTAPDDEEHTVSADVVLEHAVDERAVVEHAAPEHATPEDAGAEQVDDATAELEVNDAPGEGAPVALVPSVSALAGVGKPTVGPAGVTPAVIAEAAVQPPISRAAARDPISLRQAVAAAGLAALPEIAASYTGDSEGGVFRFDVSRPSAAVFRRGGYLWVVMSEAGRVDVAALAAVASDVVLDIQQLAVDQATVLRMSTIAGFNPVISRTDHGLTLEMRQHDLAPIKAVEIRASDAGGAVVDDGGHHDAGDDESDDAEHDSGHDTGATVLVVMKGAQEPIELIDPEIGDRFTVVSVATAGTGVAGDREFVEFRLRATAQGIVVVPFGDGVAVTRVDGGVLIGGSRGTVSSAAERTEIRDAAAGPNVLPRLYDFAAWRHVDAGSYSLARHALLAQTTGAYGQDQNEARLEFARFLFAQARPGEAIGVLAAITEDGHQIAREPDFRALRGASLFLLGRMEEARSDLIDPGLDKEPEIVLWRAALAAARGEWETASEGLREGELYAQRYPDRLRVRFSLLGADAMIRVEDPVGATAWLESLAGVHLVAAEVAQRSLIEGRLNALEGETELALAAYEKAVESSDRQSRALATLARVKLGREADTIGLDEAIDQLDRLRFVWRGDDLELEILSTLGDMYIESGAYRSGLQTLKRAATNFTEHPRIPELTEAMQRVFGDLFIGGAADELPALQAIALFNQFRELTPAGDDGDDMIRKLAQRLVSVDLLEQAAALLIHQVDFRVEGAAKAEVGASLAVVRLLDRRPEAALEALAFSEDSGVTATVAMERKLLEARAKAELGMVDDALAVIAEDASFDADQLRAEILWRARDWKRAAPVFKRLIGPAPSDNETLDQQRARFVLNLAVSLSLSSDQRSLATLRRNFGDAMQRSEFAFDFRVIAADESDAKDFESALARVAAVDDFQGFLDAYRARLGGGEEAG